MPHPGHECQVLADLGLNHRTRTMTAFVRRTFPSKRLIKPGKSIVKTDTLDTEGLEGGTYYFQVEAFDRSSREHIRQRRMVTPRG